MVIDTSAIAAILFGEPDARRFTDAIERAANKLIAAPTVLEATVVIEREMGVRGEAELDFLLLEGGLQIVAFDAQHLAYARQAFRIFGRGRHPAGLNLGDSFSYALSKATGEPLLYKGDDFAKTDVLSALQP